MFLTTRNITKDPVLADFFNLLSQDGATTAWVPPVDISEQADAIRITAEVPGVKPEDVQISLEGNVLTIRGTKQQVEEERTEGRSTLRPSVFQEAGEPLLNLGVRDGRGTGLTGRA